MKIKKVEISAFRIFDDPQNATFDLTAKSGRAAGFVSLYAPNGFGKTSFYDAVEYGMTGSVDRFYLRAEELEKMANLQSIDKFIRHSSSKRDTYVKIYTDNERKPIIDTPFYKHGKQKHDLNLDPKRRKEDPFQKVILSQEWISAFLTEINGEYRYKKFMDIPELEPINNYYNNLRHLLTAYWNKKSEVTTSISKFESIVQSIVGGNLLETINNQITLLTEKFGDPSLKKLSLSTSQEEIKTIKDDIAGKIVSNNRELFLLQILDHITIAKSGNDSTIGIKTFFSIVEANKAARNRLIELQSLLDKFELLDKSMVEVANNRAAQQGYVTDKDDATKTLSSFDEFKRITGLLQQKSIKRTELEQIVVSVNKQLEDLNRIEIDKRNQLETVLRKLSDSTTKQANVPSKRIELLNLDSQSQIVEKQFTDTKTEIDRKEKEQSEIQQKIANTQKIIDNLLKELYHTIIQNDNLEIITLIQRLINNLATLSDEKQKLIKADSAIEQHQTLNNTITDFIKTGLLIVNNRQTQHCPLCDQEYDSYSELVKQITNNKALDESLKILMSKKNTIDLRILTLSNEIKEDQNTLLNFYKLELEDLLGKNQELIQLLDRLNSDASRLEITLNQHKQLRTNYGIELDGLSFNEFEKKVKEDIEKFNKEREGMISLISENKKAIDTANEKMGATNSQLKLITREVEKLILNEQYLFVTSWFRKNLPDYLIDKELLIQRVTSLTENIRQLAIAQKEKEDKIAIQNKELESLNKDNLKNEKTDLGKLVLENEAKLNAYRYFLKDKLDIDVSQLEEGALLKRLEEKQTDYNGELGKAKAIQEEYRKLEKYSENLWPFLQSENAKLELTKAKDELDFLEQNVETALLQERNNAKNYLESRIKNFFHEDLINDLYKKIDPHPDFKFVQFKANFDADVPRLDVFIKNIKDESLLIPNLYFSTAQINILSLSIFLATALNSKEYQCIFIDDPIQSMDSINVLSTIDLLRSLVVNEGKQIIFSTHDENFHNLLKMKMPDNLFESKFLELESFGKVKV